MKKRKRHASPTSLANSVVGENNVQAGHKDAKQFKSKGLDHYDILVELCEGTLATGAFASAMEKLLSTHIVWKFLQKQISNGKKFTMSSTGIPPHELDDDDDDLADLEALELLEEHEKMPQQTAKMSDQDYVTFLLHGHPRTVNNILCVDKHTFRALVRELILRGQLGWDHKKLSIEESLAIFLYICGQSGRHRLAADKFQWSTSTISDHFNWMRRTICRLVPYVIKPQPLEATPPEILHDERYNQ
ncbi:hypothetical protein RHSIM_Rhsim09G0057200 [Rhododendron simsii]|uniref:DUF8040 domain-containing protein n=1 Tax=Rhododendron simsii TaxID=118357 RepID=A0A834LEN0_RHOSS|nr:hypothetical protein RHSIM_Rhsim09G0057200 [Rhododendron simsii]